MVQLHWILRVNMISSLVVLEGPNTGHQKGNVQFEKGKKDIVVQNLNKDVIWQKCYE